MVAIMALAFGVAVCSISPPISLSQPWPSGRHRSCPMRSPSYTRRDWGNDPKVEVASICYSEPEELADIIELSTDSTRQPIPLYPPHFDEYVLIAFRKAAPQSHIQTNRKIPIMFNPISPNKNSLSIIVYVQLSRTPFKLSA